MCGSVTGSPSRLRTSLAGVGSVMRRRVRPLWLGSLRRWRLSIRDLAGSQRGTTVGKFANRVFELHARQAARVMVDFSKVLDHQGVNDRMVGFFGAYQCVPHAASRLARALGDIGAEGARRRQGFVMDGEPWVPPVFDEGDAPEAVFSGRYLAAVLNEDEPMIEALFLPLLTAYEDQDAVPLLFALRALTEVAAAAEVDAEMRGRA